ncbi:MAG: hypothetical protein K0U29_06690, partial [Gammaproteobacteria bacterium]|nr:hypothetical protein [Gammaproteobacteria bacterium]
MRGTKKKLFYYVVKKVIKRMKGIYVVKFNQVLELDLSKIELDGGACYALVGLFYKYVALKI